MTEKDNIVAMPNVPTVEQQAGVQEEAVEMFTLDAFFKVSDQIKADLGKRQIDLYSDQDVPYLMVQFRLADEEDMVGQTFIKDVRVAQVDGGDTDAAVIILELVGKDEQAKLIDPEGNYETQVLTFAGLRDVMEQVLSFDKITRDNAQIVVRLSEDLNALGRVSGEFEVGDDKMIVAVPQRINFLDADATDGKSAVLYLGL